MAAIKFSEQQKNEIVEAIQTYFEKELDQDIGQFDAEFLYQLY
ncbi:DUF2164 family protein [Psychromonas aquatilis]|uniref:DUF2164 family protein n=1 Tax=Psychromonas aquatilis TaxID=2005072 RepID=A0ABU9GR64_9GAMM